jgi:hypothetical protein
VSRKAGAARTKKSKRAHNKSTLCRSTTETMKFHAGKVACNTAGQHSTTCSATRRTAISPKLECDAHVGVRVRTRDVAVVGTVGRFAWARGLDRPWPEWPQYRILETAARHGALALLQWAQATGCDWDADTCNHMYQLVL